MGMSSLEDGYAILSRFGMAPGHLAPWQADDFSLPGGERPGYNVYLTADDRAWPATPWAVADSWIFEHDCSRTPDYTQLEPLLGPKGKVMKRGWGKGLGRMGKKDTAETDDKCRSMGGA